LTGQWSESLDYTGSSVSLVLHRSSASADRRFAGCSPPRQDTGHSTTVLKYTTVELLYRCITLGLTECGGPGKEEWRTKKLWSNNTDFGVPIGGHGKWRPENGGPNLATSQ